jgi:hypothetical protein
MGQRHATLAAHLQHRSRVDGAVEAIKQRLALKSTTQPQKNRLCFADFEWAVPHERVGLSTLTAERQ